jgi:hypothetical protein
MNNLKDMTSKIEEVLAHVLNVQEKMMVLSKESIFTIIINQLTSSVRIPILRSIPISLTPTHYCPLALKHINAVNP